MAVRQEKQRRVNAEPGPCPGSTLTSGWQECKRGTWLPRCASAQMCVGVQSWAHILCSSALDALGYPERGLERAQEIARGCPAAGKEP